MIVEMDLVGHEGGDSFGDYIQTLKQIRERLPFPLLGIDSDNGGEFINDQLYRYCQSEQITFTRGRPYRKNDSCYVEQKNYSAVRRAVGYLRYDTVEQLEIINELYGYLRLYTNYFQPVMKLIEKTRIGSRVRKKYDRPKTPYQRVLESPNVKEKKVLRSEYAKLNPAELKRQITRLQTKLRKLALKYRTVQRQTAQSV
jgi:hypothetical protein